MAEKKFFFQIDDVPGESTDKGHQGWFETVSPPSINQPTLGVLLRAGQGTAILKSAKRTYHHASIEITVDGQSLAAPFSFNNLRVIHNMNIEGETEGFTFEFGVK
jgi:hypothetical protein